MARHEAGCTLNPKRKCYLCENNNTDPTALLALALKLRLEYESDKQMESILIEDLQAIRDQSGGCPSCILSTLRLANLEAFEKFDYKAELSEWHNAETIEKYGSLSSEF